MMLQGGLSVLACTQSGISILPPGPASRQPSIDLSDSTSDATAVSDVTCSISVSTAVRRFMRYICCIFYARRAAPHQPIRKPGARKDGRKYTKSVPTRTEKQRKTHPKSLQNRSWRASPKKPAIIPKEGRRSSPRRPEEAPRGPKRPPKGSQEGPRRALGEAQAPPKARTETDPAPERKHSISGPPFLAMLMPKCAQNGGTFFPLTVSYGLNLQKR